MRAAVSALNEKIGTSASVLTIVITASFAILLSAAASRAGDVSAQPADDLSVTNSVANVLPQGAAPPSPTAAASWLQGLHISGYGSQTFGMWQDPPTLHDFTPSRNNLAVARSLLQIDENYRLNENNTFFMREWFVYEPPYSFDSANNPQYSASSANHSSFGHYMNGFYNNYQVRDAWWENKLGPLNTFIGNQIVVWGQSLAFRVGDVINPQDTCWAFGFANLEQSRQPQWMIHPILNLPQWGPLDSNFLEVVLEPGFAPVYWPELNTPYGLYRNESTKAGRAIPCLPAASHGPSGRFDIHYDNRFNPPFNELLIPAAGGPPTLNGPFSNYNANGILAPPAETEFWHCTQLIPEIRGASVNKVNVFDPVPLDQRLPCKLGLSKGNNPYSPIGDGQALDFGIFRIPGFQPQNWNEGVRFHTLFGATEWTAFFYNDNTNGTGPGSIGEGKWTPYTNLWTYQMYDVPEFGATVDRPLPMPGMLAEYFPAVFRGEFRYSSHMSMDDQSPLSTSAQGWSDIATYMLALDIDQAYAPWLTSTGNLTINLEMLQTTVMDNSKYYAEFNAIGVQQLKNDVQLLFNLGTSWWWSDFAPTWTMLWDPKGDNFALFPSLTLNPPWTKKYFMKLQAVEIMGGDRQQNFGLFKGESYLLAQFQYNFELL
jgi:hypothetical protein